MTRLERLPARVDALAVEILASEGRTLAQVRVLHEDVVARLSLIQENHPRTRKRRT
jgi:hypothetical protein